MILFAVRPASAAQPAGRALCARGRRAEPVDARRPGRRLRHTDAAALRPDPCPCARRRAPAWDDTTVPVLAKHQKRTGRLWTYVRDDRSFAGHAPPAALFFCSRDRMAEHPERHLSSYAGILQADAYAGFNGLYAPANPRGRLSKRPAGRMRGASAPRHHRQGWPQARPRRPASRRSSAYLRSAERESRACDRAWKSKNFGAHR
jgi:hypothetical protein